MKKRLPGVTILEVLIVLAIMGLLATVVAPRVVGYMGRAKSTVAETQLNNIKSAIEFFAIDTGRYPTDAEGLNALTSAPPSATGWAGPYLPSEDALKDPWARDYLFEVSGDGLFRVYTLGRDGREGGTGQDADIAAN